MTIGQLAKASGVSRSTLRYYEEQGLLKPTGRTAAGYRLYAKEASETLRFIQRAQRLGFALNDIGLMLSDNADSLLNDIAERRYIEIERQLTELLVQRHEMSAFLADIRSKDSDISSVFDRMIDRICIHEHETPAAAAATLDWLVTQSNCVLNDSDAKDLIAPLAGRHIHIWRESNEYKILIPTHDPTVEAALQQVANIEAQCHAHETPRLEKTDEGYLFVAHGERAFLFAQFFLDLESAKTQQNT